jgi:hypothetical protein
MAIVSRDAQNGNPVETNKRAGCDKEKSPTPVKDAGRRGICGERKMTRSRMLRRRAGGDRLGIRVRDGSLDGGAFANKSLAQEANDVLAGRGQLQILVLLQLGDGGVDRSPERGNGADVDVSLIGCANPYDPSAPREIATPLDIAMCWSSPYFRRWLKSVGGIRHQNFEGWRWPRADKLKWQ